MMEQQGMLAGALQARAPEDHAAWQRFLDAVQEAVSSGGLVARHGPEHWRTVELCSARMIPERVLASIAPAEIRLLLCASVAQDCTYPDQTNRNWLIAEPSRWALDLTFAATLRRVCDIAADVTRLARAARWTYLGGHAVDIHRVVSVLHVADRLDPVHTDCPPPPGAELTPDELSRWPNTYGVSIGLIDPREGVMRIDLTSTERAQRRAAEATFLPWCDASLRSVRNILLACNMPFREVEAHDLHARPSADVLAAKELLRTRAGARRRPLQPFKFLDPYGEDEGHLLPARDEDVVRLSGRCLVSPLTVLTGESGSGKTSLAAAGLLPWLRLHDGEGVYARCLNDPIAALLDSARLLLPQGRTAADLTEAVTILAEAYDKPVVLVVDQAQELFTRLGSRTRLDFAERIAHLLSLPGELAHVLIVVQQEFMHRLADLQDVLPTIFTEVVTLPRLSREQAEVAIRRSLGRFRLWFDELVITHLLDDIGTVEGILPVELQVCCDVLRHSVEDDETRVGFEVYRKVGPGRRILSSVLDQRLRPFRYRRLNLARKLLVDCVTAQRTKALLTAEEAAVDTGYDVATVREVLEGLEQQQLLRRLSLNGKDAWELRHEYVTKWLEPWLKAAETEAKDTDDLLHRELNNFERFGTLLDREKLRLIHAVRRRLTLTPEELELLIRSAAAENYEVDYWLPRANELSVSQQMVLCIDLLYSPHAELRDSLRAMVSRLDHKAIVPTLLASLQEAEPGVRETALALLGAVDQEIVNALVSGDSTQQQQAAYALGQLGARHAVEPLVTRVQESASEGVREQAAEALAEIDRSRSTELLLRSLSSGTDQSRWNAAMALGRLGRDGSVRDRLRREAERPQASAVMLFAYARACVEGQAFAEAERLLNDLSRRAVPEAQQYRLTQTRDDLHLAKAEEERGGLSWPMYRGSASGAAYSPSGLRLPIGLKWTFTTGDCVYSSPAVAGGTVYIGSDDRKLYALDADSGQERWVFEAEQPVRSSPCVLGGIVIAADAGGTLHGLDAARGVSRWSRPLNSPVSASPRGEGAKFVLGTSAGVMHAVDARSGTVRWTRDMGGEIQSSAALSLDLVAVGMVESGLAMLRADDGEELWRWRLDGSLVGSPVLTDDAVVVASDSGRIEVLDLAGQVRWAAFLSGPAGCSAAIAHGRLYLGAADGEIAAFDLITGQRCWTFEAQGEVSASPAVAGNAVFVGSQAGELFALDALNGRQLWSYRTGYAIHSSPAVADRRLFVALRYYNMCAFAEAPAEVEAVPSPTPPTGGR